MRDIRRPDEREAIVERLTNGDFSETGAPIFATIMELLIFAAAVGLREERRVAVPAGSRGIPVRIFENNQNEGFLFLIGLAVVGDAEILSDEREDEIARIFEEYAAGGLEVIEDWISQNPHDPSGLETLLARLQDAVPAQEQPTENPSPL